MQPRGFAVVNYWRCRCQGRATFGVNGMVGVLADLLGAGMGDKSKKASRLVGSLLLVARGVTCERRFADRS